MIFKFCKYSGCGNDFIIIDDRQASFPYDQAGLVTNLCHRQTGIGADGVILLQNSTKAHFRMRIFNTDGSEAEMCGNGIRCLVDFAKQIDPLYPLSSIESCAGTHQIKTDKQEPSINMGHPQDEWWDIQLSIDNEKATLHYMNTGVPHAVEFFANIRALDIEARGALIRHHLLFAKKGTNYNAVEILSPHSIQVRTYERGVESETLACGTGATAAALAAAKKYGLISPIQVVTQSGQSLTITFDTNNQCFENVWMRGPAHKIFEGQADLASFAPIPSLKA